MFDTENKYLVGTVGGERRAGNIFISWFSLGSGQCAPVNSEKLVRLRKLVLMETGAQGAHF